METFIALHPTFVQYKISNPSRKVVGYVTPIASRKEPVITEIVPIISPHIHVHHMTTTIVPTITRNVALEMNLYCSLDKENLYFLCLESRQVGSPEDHPTHSSIAIYKLTITTNKDLLHFKQQLLHSPHVMDYLASQWDNKTLVGYTPKYNIFGSLKL
jgi:hypothetical protein